MALKVVAGNMSLEGIRQKSILSQVRELVQKELSEKSKDNYWKNYIKRNEYFEQKIEKQMTEILSQQMQEVFDQLDALPVSKGGPGSGIRGHRTHRPDKPGRRRRVRGHVSGLSIHQKEEVLRQLVEDTATNKQKAEEYFDSIVRYSGVDYAKIRSGRDKETAEKIEEFIDNSPKWDGNGSLYRGLNMQNISHWKEGKVINMKGVSSWSDDEKIAQDFSKVEGFTARKNVIFMLPGSDNGTSIKHLSANPHENEILVSKYTSFKIRKIEPKGDYIYIKVDELIQPREIAKEFMNVVVKEGGKQMTLYDKWKYDSENDLIEIEDKEDIKQKGGHGSGSWNAPGSPRFAHQGKPESALTGHERFRRGSTSGVQAKKEEDKPKKDRSKIERFAGADTRGNISKEGKYSIITKKKTGDKLYRTIREKDTIIEKVNKKTGEKVKVAVPGKLKFEDGSPIPATDKRIPPAWAEVYINKSKKCEVQVEGLDKNGDVQPLYSKAHDERASAEKQRRVNQRLQPQFKKLYSAVDADIKSLKGKSKDTASCLRMIMSTGIRPTDENDNPERVGAKKAYGAITLLGQHVFVNKKQVYVELPAKKGTIYKAEIKDPKIAADLIQRKSKAGKNGRIFDTDESTLLKYSKTKTGFIVKDYRTLKANQEAEKVMSAIKKPKTEKEFEKAVKEVTKHVSGILCNTPGMAFESYIDKQKWEPWKKGIAFTEKTKSINEWILEFIEE